MTLSNRPAVVCDASALVALLLDDGPDGQWVTATVRGAQLIAPAIVQFECANICRRPELAGLVSPDLAAQAHRDILDLAIEVWPYDLLADRTWQLRHNLSSYDASYVALAEAAGAPLVTLDRRLARASGPTCAVLTPGG